MWSVTMLFSQRKCLHQNRAQSPSSLVSCLSVFLGTDNPETIELHPGDMHSLFVCNVFCSLCSKVKHLKAIWKSLR